MVTKCIGDVIKKRRLGATAKLFDRVSEPVVGQTRIKTLETLQECIRREMTARRRALKNELGRWVGQLPKEPIWQPQ